MQTRGIALILIVILALPGCSVYKAASQPGPADLTGIGVGMPRPLLIGQLGAPKFSDLTPEGTKEDMFEFESGMHQGTKARAILYLAADVFTLGLAELVLWPLELTVMKQATCHAVATYDDKQKVQTWTVTQKDGVQGC